MVRPAPMSLLTGGRGGTLSFGHFAYRRLGVGGGPSLLDSRRIQRSPEGLMTDPIGTGSRRHPLGRRRFMAALAGGLLAAPLAAEAQQAQKVWHIGYLGQTSQPQVQYLLDALRLGLRQRGLIENRDFVIE